MRSETIKITIEDVTERALRVLYQQLGHDMQGWDDEQIAETLVEALSQECRGKIAFYDLPVREPFGRRAIANWIDANPETAERLARKVI